MKVVFVSNNDWDGLWYQRQQFATMYAERGHKVLFINKTLQRLPKLKDFKERFAKKSKAMSNPIPNGVSVVSIYTLPPLKCFNRINRLILGRKLKPLGFESADLLITYIPTYTALSIIDLLTPKKAAYINVHNYDADEVVRDLLLAEIDLCQRVDYLLADSVFNRQRLTRISGREAFDSLPGVHTNVFKQSFRGDEANKRQTIMYFGGIGSHLDFNLYNQLSDHFTVTFIGKFNSEELREKLSPKILVHPPVPNSTLAQLLKEADIIGIFYLQSDYIDGVIPAKIYECLATMKPIIATGMGEMKALEGLVYQADNSFESVVKIIKKLPDTENESCRNKRKEVASEADWEKRFQKLNERIGVNV